MMEFSAPQKMFSHHCFVLSPDILYSRDVTHSKAIYLLKLNKRPFCLVHLSPVSCLGLTPSKQDRLTFIFPGRIIAVSTMPLYF